jgi:16S rRNA (cytosine1402-N4)-methyltransferase
MKQTPKHIPVLLDKTVELLAPNRGEVYFDGTAGYGGHAAAIMDIIGPQGHAILVDRDRESISHLQERHGDAADIIHRDFATAIEELADNGNLVDMVLLDLGVSSPQLDEGGRGFSFQVDAPLDMRMDQTQTETAADIVNHYDERDLANLIYEKGEERRSRQIARAIVQQRPISTTKQLAEVISRVVRRTGKIHPATRTFQALRIAVNDELGQLQKALNQIMRILKPGGRFAVISFHSLEDRIVKEFIREQSQKGTLQNLTKKVLQGKDYDTINPRARSAKLRAAVKIKTGETT